jgi:hypothetical protein
VDFKTLAWNQDGRFSYARAGQSPASSIVYRVGTPAAVPMAPAVDAGYSAIALVNVPSGLAGVTAAQIVDLRSLLVPGNVGSVALSFSVSTASRVAPSGFGLAGSAGLGVAVLAGTSFATGAFSIFLFSPLASASAGALVGDGSAGAFVATGAVPGVVDGALQTELRFYGVGAIPGAGQPYLRIDGQVARFPGGSIEAIVPFHVQVATQW